MGLFRKVTSVSTGGLVDFRSDKERTARYTKQTRNELKKLNESVGGNAGSNTSDPPIWSPGYAGLDLDTAKANLARFLNSRQSQEYKGYGSRVTVDNIAVVIELKNVAAKLQKITPGEHVYELKSLMSVIHQEANMATNGHLQLVFPPKDGIPSPPSAQVFFTFQHRKEFAELLNILRATCEVNHLENIQTLITEGKSNAVHYSPAQGPADVAERLTKLTQLHADGLITDEEFQAKRSSLLEEI